MPETQLLIAFTAQTDGEYCGLSECKKYKRFLNRRDNTLYPSCMWDDDIYSLYMDYEAEGIRYYRCQQCLAAEALAKEIGECGTE